MALDDAEFINHQSAFVWEWKYVHLYLYERIIVLIFVLYAINFRENRKNLWQFITTYFIYKKCIKISHFPFLHTNTKYVRWFFSFIWNTCAIKKTWFCNLCLYLEDWEEYTLNDIRTCCCSIKNAKIQHEHDLEFI